MVTVEEAAMVPVAISPVISMMVTINLWPLGNIVIMLMKIQSLIFLVQPGSYAKSVSALLRERLSFIIAPTLPFNIMLVLPKKTLLSPNLMTLPLHKSTSLNIQLLPAIANGGKQVMKILMVFNRTVSTNFWLSIQLIQLILEELLPFTLPLKMHQ